MSNFSLLSDFLDFEKEVQELSTTATQDIREVLFPISKKNASDLFIRPRYVRVRQYNTIPKKLGIWSPSTDAWLVVKDCGDSKSYLDVVTFDDPLKWHCCQCPTGASCAGDVTRDGNISYVALEGYWRVSKDFYSDYTTFMASNNSKSCAQTHEFEKCPMAKRCRGVREMMSNGQLFDITEETQRVRDDNDERCEDGSTGPMCALCKEGWAKEGNECNLCTKDALGRKAGLFVAAAVLILFAIWWARRKFKKMPKRLKVMRKDLFRIFMIIVNFAQVGTSMPNVLPTVKWPNEYLQFLERLNVFNFDVLELTGTACATKIDHSAKMLAMAVFPFILFVFSIIRVLRSRNQYKNLLNHADKKERKKIWTNTLEEIFDVTDADGSGEVSVIELIQ